MHCEKCNNKVMPTFMLLWQVCAALAFVFIPFGIATVAFDSNGDAIFVDVFRLIALFPLFFLFILVFCFTLWSSVKFKCVKIIWPLFLSFSLLIVRYVWNQTAILLLFETTPIYELIRLFSTVDLLILIPQFLCVVLSAILMVHYVRKAKKSSSQPVPPLIEKETTNEEV
ncbi:MAG: hypothetical protein FWD06_09960 [Oscillospiraceae bacterium]|nr:hypothetical protein [Oscillospiraceae bacterium]